jgi:hypothetical protein
MKRKPNENFFSKGAAKRGLFPKGIVERYASGYQASGEAGAHGPLPALAKQREMFICRRFPMQVGNAYNIAGDVVLRLAEDLMTFKGGMVTTVREAQWE